MVDYNKLHFGFPLILTALTIIFSALTLFTNQNDSYIKLDLASSHLRNIYHFSNNGTLSMYQNTSLASEYTFGLWGCYADYTLNHGTLYIDSKSFCSDKSINFYPDILELINSSIEVYTDGPITNSIPVLEEFNPKQANHNAINGILASFILSILEFIALILGIIISFIIKNNDKSTIRTLSIIFSISLAQWISITVGMASFKKLSDLLYNLFMGDNDLFGILAIKINGPVFRYGWVTLALGLVDLLYITSYLIWIIYRHEKPLNQQIDEKNDEESISKESKSN